MQDPQNVNLVDLHSVHHDERCPGDDQFAGGPDATDSAKVGVNRKVFDRFDEALCS